MTATTSTDAVRQAVETVESHLHPTPSWSLDDHPVPSGREEVWRFTPLRRLRSLHADAPFTPVSGCRWAEPAGATVRMVSGDELGAWRGLSRYVPTDRTTARVFTETTGSLAVDVPAGTEVAEPVLIDLTGSGTETAEAGHVAVRVGEHARVTVVLRHGGSASLAHVVEVLAQDGSDVTVASVQDWADDTVHLAHHHLGVGRDARVRHVAVSLGGDLVRLGTSLDYAGPGGTAELYGLYFVDAGQHIEHRLFVDHNQPRTESQVDYRGALYGAQAHAVWVGDVLIRKAAEQITTYESNKNLLLTDGCRADSVPNLEIETGEIQGAGHSSTTGRFDDEQLFYLTSRGIPAEEARRLVVRGFFATIIAKIGAPELEQRLLDAVEAKLEKSVGA